MEFEGHITADYYLLLSYYLEVIDVFKCHFRMNNIVVLSFRKDKIIVQTMIKPHKPSDIDKQGFYTTIIPLSSMKEYDYDCNYEEVNVMVSKNLLLGNFKSDCINVVRADPLGSPEIPIEYRKEAVEVTFDMEHKGKRNGKPKEDIKIYTSLNESFGVHKNEPYPHFLVNSTLYYEIVEDDVMKMYESGIQLFLVDRPKVFRSFYSSNYRIFVGKETIVIDTCGGSFNTRFGARSGIGLIMANWNLRFLVNRSRSYLSLCALVILILKLSNL